MQGAQPDMLGASAGVGGAQPHCRMPNMPSLLRRFAVLAACALLTACATSRACGPDLSRSPQFASAECTFRNLDNPDAKPAQGSWRIWSRFFFAKKEGTVPVDAIPVQPLTRAQLDALPNDANHIVRLGHS